jgi:hypothetical protein
MKCFLDQDFHELLKKIEKDDVRLHTGFWVAAEQLENGTLKGKALKRGLKGYKRVVISNNNKYAALYREVKEGGEAIAKFFDIGLKREIYKRNEKKETATKR